MPQAHEWVGLTDEDKREIVTNNSSPLGGMLDAEAKLREKLGVPEVGDRKELPRVKLVTRALS